MNNRSKFPQRLRAGERLFGPWMQIPHPMVAETLAQTGVDFLLVDGEHAPIPPDSLGMILPCIDLYDMPTIYRVRWNRTELIKGALDAGVTGLMVPMVNSPEEGAAAIGAAKYPPMGTRGIGAWRASNYYQNEPAYRKDANRDGIVILQIETTEAVACVDKIAALPGLDALYVGPGDLALSFGMQPGDLSGALLDACKTVAAAARKNGVAACIDVASLEYIKTYTDLGFSLFTYGSDFGYILDGGRAAARDVRAKLGT